MYLKLFEVLYKISTIVRWSVKWAYYNRFSMYFAQIISVLVTIDKSRNEIFCDIARSTLHLLYIGLFLWWNNPREIFHCLYMFHLSEFHNL